MGATGKDVTSEGSFNLTSSQRDIENSIREDQNETVYWLDKDGHKIISATGDGDSVSYDGEDWEFNHNIEQPIWHGAEIHTTHNHPEGTIFSPEDIDAFTTLENKSMSAVVPKEFGFSAFRLIREQPITDNTSTYDMDTGEWKKAKYWTSKYEPKDLMMAYNNAYVDVWNPIESKVDKISKDYKYGKITRQEYMQQIKPFNDKINKTMVKWLEKNAKDYGFTFIKEK